MPAPEAHNPIPLSQAQAGQELVVERITEEAEADRQLLRFLWESGSVRAARLVVSEVAPYAGTITVLLDGRSVTMGLVARTRSGSTTRWCRPTARRPPEPAAPPSPAPEHGGPGALRAAERLHGLRARAGSSSATAPAERVAIPVTCYLVRTARRAHPLRHRLLPARGAGAGAPGSACPLHRRGPARSPAGRARVSSPTTWTWWCCRHLHYDHAGGAAIFHDSELVVQKDEYAYAQYPAAFFAAFYYRKNFDLPGYRWRLPRRRHRARSRG